MLHGLFIFINFVLKDLYCLLYIYEGTQMNFSIFMGNEEVYWGEGRILKLMNK